MDEIIARYDEAYPGRPVLTISEEHEERGRRTLRNLGMPEGAWWVCMHVREAGYHPGSMRRNDFRDSDPMSYLEAVRAIRARGGWVVRIGDPSMTPLQQMEGVIDYVHSDARRFISPSCTGRNGRTGC